MTGPVRSTTPARQVVRDTSDIVREREVGRSADAVLPGIGVRRRRGWPSDTGATRGASQPADGGPTDGDRTAGHRMNRRFIAESIAHATGSMPPRMVIQIHGMTSARSHHRQIPALPTLLLTRPHTPEVVPSRSPHVAQAQSGVTFIIVLLVALRWGCTSGVTTARGAWMPS